MRTMSYAKQKRRRRQKPRTTDLSDQLPTRIRDRMTALGLSQQKVADACGVAPPRITEWLIGQNLPNAESLHGLALALNVSLDWLFFGLAREGGSETLGARLPDKELARELRLRIVGGLKTKYRAPERRNEGIRFGRDVDSLELAIPNEANVLAETIEFYASRYEALQRNLARAVVRALRPPAPTKRKRLSTNGRR